MTDRTRGRPSSVLADEAQAALAARFDPVAGRFSGVSATAALLFLLERAGNGDAQALRLALAALSRTPGDEVRQARDAAAEGAVHVEAAAVAPDQGLDKTARAAVDAALRAFGWSGESGDADREGTEAHGLMIATLARASLVLGAPGYREAASRAGSRALDRRVDAKSGALLHLTGERQLPAGVADYALLVRGLLELLAATGEKGWLHEAVRLQAEQADRLGQVASADGSDGTFLSGHGVSALDLIDLARLTADRAYHDRAAAVLGAFAADMAKAPLAHLTLLRAAQRLDRTPLPG